jgi:uncharacterized membrane protein YcaP (DUF421 family)
MIQEVWEGIHWVVRLGAEPKMLNFWQMALRAIIMYVAGLAMVRLAGDRRFGGRYNDFDVILSIVFGSLLSRAINGSAPFLVAIGAGFVLVGMNRLFAFIADHSRRFNQLISGSSLILIQDGETQSHNLNKAHLGQSELMASLRSNAHISTPDEVKLARFERSGQISVIPAARQSQVIEIKVEEGVQTVRLNLEYSAEGERY